MSKNSEISQHSIIRDYFRRIRMFSWNARLFLSATMGICFGNMNGTFRSKAQAQPKVEQALFSVSSDEFHVKTVKNADEACKLAEAGFEYFYTVDSIQIYRKRK